MWAYWNEQFIDLDAPEYARLRQTSRTPAPGWAALWSTVEESADRTTKLCLCAHTPDLLMAALVNYEATLIETYRRQAKRRISKLEASVKEREAEFAELVKKIVEGRNNV